MPVTAALETGTDGSCCVILISLLPFSISCSKATACPRGTHKPFTPAAGVWEGVYTLHLYMLKHHSFPSHADSQV